MKPVRAVAEGGAEAALLPDHGFSMSFEIDFDNPLICRQDLQLSFDDGTFDAELSRARTFALHDEVMRLQAAGLALGGSLDNAVVVSGDRVLNDGGLRYADEFVRHKLLDAFGDLYLAGGPIIGQFRGTRSGHALTRRLLYTLFAAVEAWRLTTIAEAKPLAPAIWPEARSAVRVWSPRRGFRRSAESCYKRSRDVSWVGRFRDAGRLLAAAGGRRCVSDGARRLRR